MHVHYQVLVAQCSRFVLCKRGLLGLLRLGIFQIAVNFRQQADGFRRPAQNTNGLATPLHLQYLPRFQSVQHDLDRRADRLCLGTGFP